MSASEGVYHHATGNFDEARAIREAEFFAMAPDDPYRPGAAGTLALTCERQGDAPHALYFAEQAINTATPINEREAPRQIRDEQWASTRINAGIVFFRSGARGRLADEYPATGTRDTLYGDHLLGEAWERLAADHEGIRPHQHAINLIARMAMKEAVNDNPRSAFKYAVGAVALAPLSESPRLAEHTSGFGMKARFQAKKRAIVRSAVAVAVAGTSLPVIRRQPAARRIRDKMIIAAM